MNMFDINRPVTAHSLNENLYKQFNVRINFDKYTREQLEDYRNLLRTKVNQLESGSNFNDLLTNETYQKDKYVLGVLNTKINEMLGESKSKGKAMKTTEAKKAKPDFLDKDKDGNKKEPMKSAAKSADGKKKDGKSAKGLTAAQKKLPAGLQKAIAGKKKVKESRLITDSKVIIEAVVHYLREDEEGKAKAITSGVDMVNDFTSWMQRVANYQTKTMIELSDSIRANFGAQEAETFKSSVGAALEGSLNSLTMTREEINNAVAVLAGEAPAANPMGQENVAPELNKAAPDDMNAPAEDEFAASDAASGGAETLGRMKRESIDRGNRLMKILGS